MPTKPRRKSVDKWETNNDRMYHMGDDYNHDFHFFCSSWEYHRESTNLIELMDFFHKKQSPFMVWYVPLSLDEDYMIENYQPQVEGAKMLVGYSLPEHDQ